MVEKDTEINHDNEELTDLDDSNEFDEFDEIEQESALSEETEQFLTFKLGKELYGIEVNRVSEVIEYANIFKIPLTPDYIAGVTNLRGEVVPIIDLNARFFSRKSEITRFSCIVFVETRSGANEESILLGIIIDAIMEVADIPEDNIEPTPGFGLKIRSDYVQGIGKISDKFIVLLNTDRVLDVEELSSYDTLNTGSDYGRQE